MKTISRFMGETRWLSNFEYATVEFENELYLTTEHAYQAAKTLNQSQRKAIRDEISPSVAKKMGRKVTIRDDWESVKLQIMYDLNLQKFSKHPELQKLLLNTGDALLEEGNNWGDTYWGVVDGKGENHLGKILMKVRAEIRKKEDERLKKQSEAEAKLLDHWANH